MKKKWIVLIALLLVWSGAQAEMVFRDADTPSMEAPSEGQAEMSAEPTPVPVLERVEDPNEPWPRRIVITVGGDCTLGSTENQAESPNGFPAVVQEKGLAWPFSELASVFSQDDLTLVNFEGTLTESTDKTEKKFNFKGPAEYAAMLTLGSVEAVTLANNHFGDYGESGKADTMQALTDAGVAFCAKGQTATYTVRGVKIGLIGHTFPYQDGKQDISKEVRALREDGCQIVIASFHWGSEYAWDYTRDQRNIGRAAIKAGADAVIGHHPHVIQGIERYEDTYILYSLANLVFGGNTDPNSDKRQTYIAQLAFTVHEDGSVEGPELTILPMRLTALEKGTDYRPVFAEGDDYEAILQAILRRSANMDGFVNPEINR